MAINLKQNPDSSAGLEGTDGGDGGFVLLELRYNATSQGTILTLPGVIMNRRMIVKAIQGVPETASSNAVTASVFRAPSGTALGSGTALHSGTFNLQGTAATNQTLALATNAATLDIPAGTRIGVVISGAMGAAGNGCITVTLAPA